MSDFLFQNISNIFHGPQAVLDILQNIEAVREPQKPLGMNPNVAEDLSINGEGEVELQREYVIGQAKNLFGDKIFDTEKVVEQVDDIFKDIALSAFAVQKEEDKILDKLSDAFHQTITSAVLNEAQVQYGRDLSKSSQKQLERKINAETEAVVHKVYGDFRIQQNTLEAERLKRAAVAETYEERQQVDQEIEARKQQAVEALKQTINGSVEGFIKSAGETVVETVETEKREAKKRTIEDGIRDHLRGFSRTIPSFLMAYGDENTTLETFDQIIPDEVFQEVTSITIKDFRFLRDGGPYTSEETGQEEFFKGHLFDPVVFDDSVKEFLNKKRLLADYFNEKTTEDIFGYIPPQKTNQIFTPKWVVRDMVNRLEEENPGCFDDPNKTFADLYMKSGMYITEIVTRLFQSQPMKQLYSDEGERLNHILGKQVYGCAPTEIIYRICLSYILGFSDEIIIKKHNIKLCDTLKYAKDGTLEQKLGELFPELKGE